jgi:CheY-like chemotaxis protein
MTTFKVLMIDDNPDALKTLIDFAEEEGFEIIYRRSLEEGLDELKTNSEIQGLILDGKGITKKSDTQEAFHFATKAFNEIDKHCEKSGKYYPKVWYTGNKDLLAPMLDETEKIFGKDEIGLSDEKGHELFRYLRAEVEKSDDYKINSEFSDVLAVFDEDYLRSSKNRSIFIGILKDLKNDGKGNYTLLRKILESVMKDLMNRHTIFPSELGHRHGNPNLTYFIKFLKGREENAPKNQRLRVTQHIANCFELVLNTTNHFSHDANDNRPNVKNIKETIYTLRATVFALSEILLWYRRTIDRNGELMD